MKKINIDGLGIPLTDEEISDLDNIYEILSDIEIDLTVQERLVLRSDLLEYLLVLLASRNLVKAYANEKESPIEDFILYLGYLRYTGIVPDTMTVSTFFQFLDAKEYFLAIAD